MARVELTTPGADDEAEFIAAMAASAEVHRPWLFPPITPEAYRGYLARLLGDRKYGFLARRTEDGALVGWFNVSDIVRGALQGANLSYGGVAAHRRQGYMSEALQLVLHEAFETFREDVRSDAETALKVGEPDVSPKERVAKDQ